MNNMRFDLYERAVDWGAPASQLMKTTNDPDEAYEWFRSEDKFYQSRYIIINTMVRVISYSELMLVLKTEWDKFLEYGKQ